MLKNLIILTSTIFLGGCLSTQEVCIQKGYNPASHSYIICQSKDMKIRKDAYLKLQSGPKLEREALGSAGDPCNSDFNCIGSSMTCKKSDPDLFYGTCRTKSKNPSNMSNIESVLK